jgi:hypothetical protein
MLISKIGSRVNIVLLSLFGIYKTLSLPGGMGIFNIYQIQKNGVLTVFSGQSKIS